MIETISEKPRTRAELEGLLDFAKVSPTSPKPPSKIATSPKSKWVIETALQHSGEFNAIVSRKVDERNAAFQRWSDREYGRGYRHFHDRFQHFQPWEQDIIVRQSLAKIKSELEDEKSTWLARDDWKAFIDTILSSEALDYLDDDQLRWLIQCYSCSEQRMTGYIKQEIDALRFKSMMVPFLAFPLLLISSLPFWCPVFIFAELWIARWFIMRNRKAEIIARHLAEYRKLAQLFRQRMKTEISLKVDKARLTPRA